jgi:putative metal-binding protein
MLLVLGAFSPSFALVKTVTIERRPPVNQYCPIDNVDYDLTFVAEQPFARLSFQAINTTLAGAWVQNLVDNVAVIDTASYVAHVVVAPGFQACYAAPGDPNAPALDFNAGGTAESYLALFDSGVSGWDLNGGAYFAGISAPRSPALGTDTMGGALGLGTEASVNVSPSTTITISNLTPGTQYVVTGWWYARDTSRPLTITIDTLPCSDADSDGVSDCAGDCGVRDASIKPGAVERCDGVDNDCDGQVDEDAPCDRTCEVTQALVSGGRLTTSAPGSTSPALVWTGNRYMTVFEDAGQNPDIYLALATSAGAALGAAGPLAATTLNDRWPRASWTGSEIAVSWKMNTSLVLQRFSAGGLPLEASVGLAGLSSQNDDYDVAWTGQEYGLIFGTSSGMHFRRFDPTGVPLTPVILLGATTFSPGGPKPRLAWNGTHYGAVWEDGSPKRLKFRLIAPLSIAAGTINDVGPAAGTALYPAIAAGGGTFGIAWSDTRNVDSEIYFARFSSAGFKLGADVRVTNAAGGTIAAAIAWSGAEWGIAWDDTRTGNEEIWFARVDASGVKVGSDFQVTSAPGHSRTPSIVWAGGKYGVAWSDDRESLNDEIYFTPLGCDCVNGDGDGSSSCIDCADADASVYPGAPDSCIGTTNLDCDSDSWPFPAPVDDGDGDGFSPCEGDCNDAHAGVWATPGETQSIALSHDKSTGVTTLSWLAPASPGGTTVVYDTLRSSDPSDFTVATCVEQNDSSNTIATDATTPASRAVFYYLVRAENACPIGFGFGSLGTDSAGVPRASRTCP